MRDKPKKSHGEPPFRMLFSQSIIMSRSQYLNDSVLDMTNTGKALIVGLVVVDLAFISYQLFPKDDEKAKAPPDAAVTNSVTTAAVDPQLNTHVTAGNVVAISPSANGTGEIAGTSPAAKSRPAANNAVKEPRPEAQAPTPAPAAAPAPAPVQVQAQAHKQPGRTPGSADARESVASKASPAQPDNRARDDLSRHGSNAVAAAITQELVRESSKPDPSLPMPPSVQAAPANQDHSGSNSVAAAMTQALVRESAKVNPASQPVARSGTQ